MTPPRLPLANTVMVTIANGRAASGYIPDDESYGHQSFQVLGARNKVGCAEASIAGGLAGMIGPLCGWREENHLRFSEIIHSILKFTGPPIQQENASLGQSHSCAAIR